MRKELALGMMRLPTDSEQKIDYVQTNQLIDYFLEHGFRRFDTAEIYHGTLSEVAVRECIVKRYPREAFEIADKLSSWRIPEGSTAEQFFNKQLQVSGLEYFDRYLLHSVEERLYLDIAEKRYFDFIFEKKAQGVVREAGFSFHGKPELLDKILAEYPETDFVQLQINYIDWENPAVCSRRCYEIARKYGKKVLIMEPVKGGLLAELPAEGVRMLKEISPERSVASWAIRFAAGLDGVDTVLSGISNMAQMQDNVAIMKEFDPLSDAEMKTLEQLRSFLNKNPMVACTGCGYCLGECPSELPIPGFIRLLNNSRIFGPLPQIKNAYKMHTEQHKADECVSCGRCVSVCPQHLDIPHHLSSLAAWAKENNL